MMATRQTEITIGRSADEVWAVTGDFGEIGWIPGIESCEVAGDIRSLSLMGMAIKERLVRRDEASRTLTYTIAEGPFELTRHEASVIVDPDGGGSKVTWTVDVEPDELADVMIDVYGKALEALKTRIEG